MVRSTPQRPSSAPVRVGEVDWRTRLESQIRRRWWEEKALRSFEPATIWTSRLLGRVPGRRKMLALVAGDTLPERWADHSFDVAGRLLPPEPWRRKLLPIGQYWNPEAVGAALARAGVVLDVVAPEARFCDFWPLAEIPECPWASRPKFYSAARALARAERRGEKGIPGGVPGSREDRGIGTRFSSSTPVWHGPFGSYLFYNTDCPSAFGYWPYVRAGGTHRRQLRLLPVPGGAVP